MKLILFTTDQKTVSESIEWLKEFQMDDIFATHILGRAYNYIPMVKIFAQSPTGIQATVNENYSLNIELIEGSIIGQCSCPYENPCKHLAALMLSVMQPENF